MIDSIPAWPLEVPFPLIGGSADTDSGAGMAGVMFTIANYYFE